MSRPSYTAVCRRIGDWWAIDVPELRGVHTQVRRLDQAEAMTRDAIALLQDVAVDSFDVRVEPHLDEDMQRTVAAATSASQRSRLAAEQAGDLQRQAAQALVGQYRLTVRDAGTLLHVSPQRVSQLASEQVGTTKTGSRQARPRRTSKYGRSA